MRAATAAEVAGTDECGPPTAADLLPRRALEPQRPYRRLLTCLLRDATWDAIKGWARQRADQPRTKQQARAADWLFDDDEARYLEGMSARAVCDALGIDLSYLRRGLKQPQTIAHVVATRPPEDDQEKPPKSRGRGNRRLMRALVQRQHRSAHEAA